ncbi:MAG: uroporphyrinogen-III synthase [Erythrobacter sp.]
MSLRVFTIRPEPGLSSTIAAGVTKGIPIIGHALSRIEPRGWTLPDLDRIDGLLIGSANAVRHAGKKLEALKQVPVLAVGKATARTAGEAGFTVENTGSGGLQQLLDQLPGRSRHLLRLAGEEHVPLVRPAQINLTTRIVYRAQMVAMSDDFANFLRSDAIVLLHSATAAAHFATECDRMEIARGKISLIALGPRILEPVGAGWRRKRAAERPEEGALLAMAQDLCQ